MFFVTGVNNVERKVFLSINDSQNQIDKVVTNYLENVISIVNVVVSEDQPLLASSFVL